MLRDKEFEARLDKIAEEASKALGKVCLWIIGLSGLTLLVVNLWR